MKIIDKVKELNFSKDQYIVVGSSIMNILGMKTSNDIDIVVTQELFDKCKENGWIKISWTYVGKEDSYYLKKDDIELYLDVNCVDFNPTFDELFNNRNIIEGINFVSLNDLLNFKKEYYKSGKEKHLNDIKLIEDWVKK